MTVEIRDGRPFRPPLSALPVLLQCFPPGHDVFRRNDALYDVYRGEDEAPARRKVIYAPLCFVADLLRLSTAGHSVTNEKTGKRGKTPFVAAKKWYGIPGLERDMS